MDRRLGVVTGLSSFLSLACRSQPVGLTAQAGSTIGIAVTGEVSEGGKLGYGGLVGGTTQIYDDQRGELLFVLKPQGGGSEVELATRMVTRVFPDPASDVGLNNDVGFPLLPIGLGQPIALVHIPPGVDEGTYDIEVRRRRRTGPTTWETFLPNSPGTNKSPLNQPRELTVVPGDGAETPFEGMLGINNPVPTLDYLPGLYPHPKVVVSFGSTQPAAAHLVVNYPETKMQVYGVIEEQHFGRGSIVAFQDDAVNGELTIDFVDPDASVAQLAIVFELLAPFSPSAGRVNAPGDFTLLTGTQLYDADGAPISNNVTFGPIR
jgi:hypothetical protein